MLHFFKHPCTFANSCFILLAPVVQGVDNAIYWINIYPVDSAVGFVNTNPLDSNLSVRKKYPSFEQLGFGKRYFESEVSATKLQH